MKPGDLVRIDPMWFGYDNILPQWNDSVFIVLEVCKAKMLASDKRVICNVLTPEGAVYQFYDYEITPATAKNYRENVLL